MSTTAAATTATRAVECPASALGPSAWTQRIMTTPATTTTIAAMTTAMTIASAGGPRDEGG